MEIITSIKYNHDRHEFVKFFKNEIKPFYLNLLDPRVVRREVDNKKHLETIEELIKMKWTGFRIARGVSIGQLVRVDLDGGLWTCVNLIQNGNGDRAVMLLSGKDKEVVYVHIGYIGYKETFDEYMKLINISDFEVHSDVTHILED